MEGYAEIMARFYDVIYADVRSGADHRFYVDTMASVEGKVLEIGVGTGRLFMDALAKGVDIYGIDPSAEMLDVLYAKGAKELKSRVSVMDVQHLSFPYKFDLIVAPFRVFSHIVEMEEQLLSLKNIYNHLKPGGSLIFDLFIPSAEILVNGLQRHPDFDGFHKEGCTLRRFSSAKVDTLHQLSKGVMEFEWQEEAGGEIHTAEWSFVLRYYHYYELQHLLERSPFDKWKIYGDFHLRCPKEGSGEFVIVATR